MAMRACRAREYGRVLVVHLDRLDRTNDALACAKGTLSPASHGEVHRGAPSGVSEAVPSEGALD